MKEQRFYGKVAEYNEEGKFIKASILHWGKINENRWRAMTGSLDAFLARLNEAGKGVAGCYQHDENQLIGVWRNFEITDTELIGKLYFTETPFVVNTVIPQVKAGILQGASPTIAPIRQNNNTVEGCVDVLEGVLCEISLVGLPADLRADILEMRAKVETDILTTDIELFLLTN